MCNRQTLVSLLLVIGLGVAVYGNSLNNAFVYDDLYQVERHPYTRDLTQISGMFATSHFGQRSAEGYRPLATLSFAVNYTIHGRDPFGYRIVNVILHGLNSGLVLLLTKAALLSFPAALISGLVFAVHPVHTEAVVWVSGRSELLATFFFLLTWFCYIRATSSSSLRRGYWVCSLLVYVLALLSKEHALTLPLVLFLYDVYARRIRHESLSAGWLWSRVKLYLGYGLLIALYLALRYALFEGHMILIDLASVPFVHNPLVEASLYERALTGITIIGSYLGLLAWPYDLSVDYSYAQMDIVRSFFAPEVLASLGLIVICLLAMIVSFGRSGWLWLPMAFLFLTLAPVTNIFILVGTIMAERLLYLPSVGFCMVAGGLGNAVRLWLQGRPFGRTTRLAWGGVLVVIIGALSLQTLRRNTEWKDDATLWQSALRVSPRSAKAHLNLALVAYKQRRWDDAISELREALRIYPSYEFALLQLGNALNRKGDVEGAIKVFQGAIRDNPKNVLAYINLGVLLKKEGSVSDAIQTFQEGIRRNPDAPRAEILYFNLGNTLLQQGAVEEAIPLYEKAVQLRSNYPQAYNNLAHAYLQANKPELARQALDKARELRRAAWSAP